MTALAYTMGRLRVHEGGVPSGQESSAPPLLEQQPEEKSGVDGVAVPARPPPLPTPFLHEQDSRW
jgi:hypothetical protein